MPEWGGQGGRGGWGEGVVPPRRLLLSVISRALEGAAAAQVSKRWRMAASTPFMSAATCPHPRP